MKGTHIAITYKSNICCNCCEYKCAPYKKGSMSIKEFRNRVLISIEEGYGDYLNIEGGEPFLNTALLFKYLKSLQDLSLPIFIRTNGYWGNMQPYYDILQELKKIGLTGIIFEYDFYHSLSIYFKTIVCAIEMSLSLGLEVKVIAYFDSETIATTEDSYTFNCLKTLKNNFNNISFICKVINSNRKNNNKYIYFRNMVSI